MAFRYTAELLRDAARAARTWDEAVRLCGRAPTPGSRRYLRGRMKAAGIDVSHIDTSRARHTEETLRRVAAESRSMVEVVRRLGISPVGGNQAHIGRRMAALGIDISHFAQERHRGERPGTQKQALGLGTPEAGRVPAQRLTSLLTKAGAPYLCDICGTGPAWNGRPLRLEVDHINGQWWDNRRENLRFLCPNCHSITDTYRGRRRPTETS